MDILTAIFRDGAAVRRRSVGAALRTAVIDVPIPAARLVADWQREATVQLGLEPGDIEALPLGRTRLRWPELPRCRAAVGQWLAMQGMPGALDASAMALMASRGTPYHHDGAQYGSAAFCNLFLSEDSGADFHFPAVDQRIALVRGTAVLFDPCQPHAIIGRGAPGFDAADFAGGPMPPQVFLTWELPIENDAVQRVLGITIDTAPLPPPRPQGNQVLRNGAPAHLCPKTGGWLGHT